MAVTPNGSQNEDHIVCYLFHDILSLFHLLIFIFILRFGRPDSLQMIQLKRAGSLSFSGWTPPILQDSSLTSCRSHRGHSMCSWLWELAHRHDSNKRAWEDFSGFFLEQLRLAEDYRTKSLICVVLDVGYAYYHYKGRVPARVPEAVIEQSKGWHRERPLLDKKYRHIGYAGAEWAYNHHGLRWLPQSVKDYIRERDIIDVGASIGDSLTILDEYTNRKVISYELIPDTAEIARKAAARLPPEKHFVFLCGLSNFTGNLSVPIHGDGGSGIHSRGSVVVPISTIDSETKRLNLTVGLIKADVEGSEIEVLKGALETIQRDRPVVTMSIYHNIEFLDLPKLLLQLGYKLRFSFQQYSWHLHWEMICLAIPDIADGGKSGSMEKHDTQPKCPLSFR
jgi:FkbM family methyltransferase